MIDPLNSVPQLWVGGALVARPSDLATASGTVQGVAADGVARILLRISATNGDSVQINVVDGSGGTSTASDEIGTLGTVEGGGGTGSSVSTTAIDDGYGAYAYALYQAPLNFARTTVAADNVSVQRDVQLQIACTNSNGTQNSNLDVTIVRPPVFLIHGLWSSGVGSWSNFIPVKGDENLLWNHLPNNGLAEIDYKQPLPLAIVSTTPSYKSSLFGQITRNAMGFKYNAPFILDTIRQYLSGFRTSLQVAAVQADIVSHSMGGDIARTLPSSEGSWTFGDNGSYGKGPIHKLITIGTPHTGTPLASQFLNSNNNCTRNALASNGSISLMSVTFSDNSVASGAVGDLINGVSESIPFPIAYIAGSTLPTNLSSLGQPAPASKLVFYCGTLGRNSLALNLNPQGWNTIFNSESNDGIVPVQSQLNGTTGTSASLLTFPGVIHSPGIEPLGFSPPSELDSASGIPDSVMDLLNESTSGNDFHQ